MEKYNYRESVKADIRKYIKDNYFLDCIKEDYSDLMHMYECLFDEVYDANSITGYASGSYTGNRPQAEENLRNNLGLVQEAHDEECLDYYPDFSNPEEVDVYIRCYLIRGCLIEVLQEFWNEEF